MATTKKASAPKREARSKVAGMSSDAVKAKTGKTWDQWFAILDKAGAADMSHKQIAQLLYEKRGVPGWWSQMVTVGYEQARLGRKKHQKGGVFEVSASKTVNVPIDDLYKAWADTRTRRKWLDEDIEIRTKTPNKSMRITWPDATTIVVAFVDKGPGKSQVAVQHGKISTEAQAAAIKAAWKPRMERLKALLEG